MRRRPIGVTLLGGLDLLGAATYAFFCIFSIVNQRAFRSMFERLDAGPVDPAIFLRLGPLLPVYFLIMIAVAAALIPSSVMTTTTPSMAAMARITCRVAPASTG